MTNEHSNTDYEALAKRLEANEAYRVLRTVPRPYCDMPEKGQLQSGRCIAIVDLETTGLDPERDRIIEIAVMLCFVDDNGEVVGHSWPTGWLEDPEEPLEPEITMLTGLANHHLTGCKIPDDQVERMLSRADLLVAHNAPFEIAWIERRYPALRSKAWACSMNDIPWLALGLDGRAQTSLLLQHGWFARAHRAATDVWSLFWLLGESKTGWLKGRRLTHLQRLLAVADCTTTMVEARGASYDAKNLLKARGYRWNAAERFWAKELEDVAVEHERCWFDIEGLPAPTIRPITAHERHR